MFEFVIVENLADYVNIIGPYGFWCLAFAAIILWCDDNLWDLLK